MRSDVEKIAVIGLGYVGLPLAVGLANKFADVVGFDIARTRVEELNRGEDRTREVGPDVLRASNLRCTADEAVLDDRTLFIVTVPTPIDSDNRPDLSPVRAACRTVGRHLRSGAAVVFESTVYPGVTEDICGPLLEEISGLKRGRDFTLGYSPERINPGDKEHRLETIVKVVAAEDAPTLDRLQQVYGAVVDAGLHLAPSIKVAEAAKVLENTQRDLNIALMNELSLILDRMGIRTKDVLEAAGTKWNFLRFSPGLVGGHCIGVDPYYLTFASEQLGYDPQVILAGRRVNDGMGQVIARRTASFLPSLRGARIGVLGLTFKENVPDLRNSKVPDIIAALTADGAAVFIHDPLADPEEARHEYGLNLSGWDALRDLDALVVAVPHTSFAADLERIFALLRPGGVLIDVRSMIDPARVPDTLRYWSL